MSILFSLDQIRTLHLEPTTTCNAACPQCPRTYKSFTPAEIRIEQAKILFKPEFISQLRSMFMCGNLGDPAAAKDTIEIYELFRQYNPTISFGLHTNGSLRTQEWWHRLGQLFNQKNDYVVFSIDGLEDTNHIYRINTNWQKIMENAAAFIAAGGRAFWDMLVFEHNEHQMGDALAMANRMGFKKFSVKVSSRHQRRPVEFLKPPKNFTDPVVEGKEIHCKALKEKSIYVDAQGQWHPCCWQGLYPHYDVVTRFNDYIASWTTDTPNEKCLRTCGEIEGKNSFTNQWVKTINLNVNKI